MRTRPAFFLIVLSVLFLADLSLLQALDLGLDPASSEEPMKVEVVNEDPVKTTESDTSEVRQIARFVQLDFEEDYQSPYLDVREYRNIAFYVLPEKMLREPETPVHYRLDAFFSMDTGTASYKKFGEKEDNILKNGRQEFGSTQVRDEGTEGTAAFTKLTPQDGRKFRIPAFLSR